MSRMQAKLHMIPAAHKTIRVWPRTSLSACNHGRVRARLHTYEPGHTWTRSLKNLSHTQTSSAAYKTSRMQAGSSACEPNRMQDHLDMSSAAYELSRTHMSPAACDPSCVQTWSTNSVRA